MTTLGDVWAITALIVGIAACTWALLLCLVILFNVRSRFAKEQIRQRPGASLGVGLTVTLVFGTIAVGCLSNPLPGVKLAGWALTLALMAVSFAGSAGLVLLASDRLQQVDEGLTAYGALSRGAMLVVLPCIFPILGWFLVAPVIFSMGVGAGLAAIRRREPELATSVM